MPSDSRPMNASVVPPLFLPIRQISTINSAVCTSLGGVLNLLLVWLVLKKTPKEMRVYSKILLQTCVCDLLLLALSEVVQPIPFVINGVFFILENGYALNFPSPYHVVAYHLWIYLSFLGIAGICVQFIYRYLILCRLKDLGVRDYFGILLVGMASQCVVLGPFFWVGFPPGGEFLVRDAAFLQLIGDSVANTSRQLRTVLYGDIRSPGWFCWLFFGALNNVVAYAIILHLGIKMVVHVRKNLKMGGQRRAMEINRQMTLNMIIQAALPLVNISIYTTVIVASFLPDVQWLQCVTMLLGPLINWVPVLNPLVTILTVGPYRRTLVRVGQSLPSDSNSRHPNNSQQQEPAQRRTSSMALTREEGTRKHSQHQQQRGALPLVN